MSSSDYLSFVCGVLATTAISLALFILFGPHQKRSNEHEAPAVRDLDARGMEPGMLPPPPAYAPPLPAVPPIYIQVTSPPAPPPQQIPFVPYYPNPVPGNRTPPPADGPGPQPVVATRIPPIQRPTDLQLLVHQRQNLYTQQWEEHSPTNLPTENVAFVIYSRTQRFPLLPAKIYLLEIHSEVLMDILKDCNCLKFAESVFDAQPRVPDPI